MREYLDRHVIYSFTRPLCFKWAEVKYEARSKGDDIDTADAWIAATALMLNVPLVTHNPSDFRTIKDLHVVSAM